jgi:hypothetical protein
MLTKYLGDEFKKDKINGACEVLIEEERRCTMGKPEKKKATRKA